ncbi:MAG TPA: hypothetical protein VFZ78_00655 [Flavisolibacter sp.]
MKRILLAFAIFFMSCSVVAHGVLAYQFSAVQTLLPEEEPHSEKNDHKPAVNDRANLHYLLASLRQDELVKSFLEHTHFLTSKGFADKPYTPPDLG